MKKILIILLAVLLIISGCSTGTPEVSKEPESIGAGNEINEDEQNEFVNDNEESTEEEIEIEDEDSPVTEDSVEEIQESKATEEAPLEEVAKEEPPVEEPSSEETDDENSLKIQGLAENELSLSLDELKAMNDIIFEADFYSLNNFGTTGYTHFKGVKLWDLLEGKAVIKPEATKVSIVAHDGYLIEFTVEQVKMEYMDETNSDNKYPIIIAWEENGKEYSTDEGAPYKLVVGQKEPGDINKPQWVSNIDAVIVE